MSLTPFGFPAGPDVPREAQRQAKKKVQGWSRAKKLKAFSLGPRRLGESLKRFPGKMWAFKPAPSDWCVGEVIWHLADQEANLYFRLRKAATEPGGPVPSWDENLWSKKTLYRQADFGQGRDVFAILRQANAALLKRLPATAWKNKVSHPEFGEISVDYMVGLNIWHTEHHLGQMAKRLRQWKEK